MKQLGQFGEENKHFLPVLGLAARQPADQLRFPGATGLGGAGSLRGAEGRHFPTTLGGREAGGDSGSGGRPSSEPGTHVNSKGYTQQTQAHLPQPVSRAAALLSYPGVPVGISFALRMGFLSGGQHALPGLRAKESASCLAMFGYRVLRVGSQAPLAL